MKCIKVHYNGERYRLHIPLGVQECMAALRAEPWETSAAHQLLGMLVCAVLSGHLKHRAAVTYGQLATAGWERLPT